MFIRTMASEVDASLHVRSACRSLDRTRTSRTPPLSFVSRNSVRGLRPAGYNQRKKN